MVNFVELSAGEASLVLAPEMGGGIAHLTVAKVPVLRSFAGNKNDPFSLASNILTPFSNRISKMGFTWRGKTFALKANVAGETFPIHGDGFQKPWKLIENTGESAKLTLPDGLFGPWRYSAKQTLRLFPDRLLINLTIVNNASEALPFGCGFHPWFPRNSDTKIAFSAEHVWQEDAQYLPIKQQTVEEMEAFNFTNLRPLPNGWINNAFTKWQCTAEVVQNNSLAKSCSIEASNNLDTLIIYSPNEASDFFCLEPVSHPVDAFHLAGNPGLKELSPKEALQSSMTISWNT